MSIVVKSERREGLGKNAARRLRLQGFIPAVLYGETKETVPLVLKKKDIIQIMKLETRENTIFKVAFDAESVDAMIKELQVDPTTDQLIHADLIRIAMDKPIRVTIPIVHSGEPFGVKTENLTAPAGVRVITDPATVLVLISLPHKEEEFPGEKPAEEVVAEEGKEPEVIKKERAPREGEEEPAKAEKPGKAEKPEKPEKKEKKEKKER
jgi:large subunit ribosomal protein L25